MDRDEFLSQVAAYHREHSLEALAGQRPLRQRGERGEEDEEEDLLRLLLPSDVVYISSKTGVGMENLVEALSSALERLDF